MATESDPWMKSREAAGYLKIALGTLHNLTSEGAIRFRKKRGRLYFRRSWLDEWVASGEPEDNARNSATTER